MPADDAGGALQKRVQDRLAELGIPQRTLARSLEISPSTLSRLLQGTTARKAIELIELLRDIERELGFEDGELRAMLDVPQTGSLKAALARDSSLPLKAKQVLSDLIDVIGSVESATVSSIADRRRSSPRPKKAAAEGGKARPSGKAADRLADHAAERKPSPKPKPPRPRKKPDA